MGTGSAPSGTIHAAPRSIVTRVSGARSSNRTDHGGLMMLRPNSAPSDRTSSSRLASASTLETLDAQTSD